MVAVSVVIPSKDRAEYISRTIKSVASQTIKDIELILVDDGSEDNTKDIVIENKKIYNFPIKYLKNKISVGGAKARNQGAKIASGKYLAFLDSDDEWEPEHLELGIKIIESNNYDGVYGDFKIVKSNKNVIKNRYLKPKLNNISFAEYILSGVGDTRTSTFIFKHEAFSRIEFDPLQAKHQDWDLAIRFSEEFNLGFNENSTVNIHEDIENRMSFKVNHDATTYFLEKHEKKLSPRAASKFYYFLASSTLRLEGKNEEYFRYRRNIFRNYRFSGEIKTDLKFIAKIFVLSLPKWVRYKIPSMRNKQ